MRTVAILAAVLTLLAPACAQAAAAAPPNPVIDHGACPFECCTYRDWTTNAAVILLDKPGGMTQIATVPPKTVVRGVTGDVYSAPIRLVAKHAYEDSPIRKGDVFYALHSAGEGFWTVWFKGKTANVEFDGTETGDAGDKSLWWVKIRTRGGKTGWVLNTGQFDNQDSCG